MPSKSAKQARFMRAVAHSKKFAKKAGVPQSVGREYVDADKRAGRYAGGGRVSKITTLSSKRREKADQSLDRLVESFRRSESRQRQGLREIYPHEQREFEELVDEYKRRTGADDVSVMERIIRGSMKKANGGRVSKLRRLERLLDENPGIDKVINRKTLELAADSDFPLINLEPSEYLDMAARVGPDYKDIFAKESKRIARGLNSRSKLGELPYLGVVDAEPFLDMSKSVGTSYDHLIGDVPRVKVKKVEGHDGRHRAFALGEKGYKVPTTLTGSFGSKMGPLVEDLQDVLLLPENEIGERLPLMLRRRAFNEGGLVDELQDEDSRLERLLKLTDRVSMTSPGLGNRNKVINSLLKGFARNWAGVDDRGHLRMGETPGIVKYTKGLPAMAMDISDLILPNAPWAGAERPEWSTRALEEAALQEELVDQATPMSRHIPILDEAADMLMQVPIPARGAIMGAQKVPKIARSVTAPVRAVAEYLGPTVEPKISSYAIGAGGGAGLGLLGGGEDSELERILAEVGEQEAFVPGGFADRSYRGAFANGGRVRRTAGAIKAIKEAISHLDNKDTSSALRALATRDVADDPSIAEVRRLLRSPEAIRGRRRLAEEVERDTNETKVPLL